MSNLKILVIDDDDSIIELISEGLKPAGFLVETAYDGEDGIRKVGSFRPDYVIVDCLMPRMDGFEFLKALRENPGNSSIKVIMMSGVFTDQPFIQQTITEHKPEIFLVKPFEVKELLKFIKSRVKKTTTLPSGAELDDDIISLKGLKKKFLQRGDFSELSFIKILYYTYALRSTGVLTVNRGKDKWVLYFYKGNIVKTVSNVQEDYFGSIAVSLGIMSDKERDNCLAAAQKEKRRVGDVMVAMKKLKVEAVVDILKAQAEKRVTALMMIHEASFMFQHALVNKAPKIYLQLNAMEYLLHKGMSKEEFYFSDKMKPYLSLKPQLNKSCLIPQQEFCFTSIQRDIYSKISTVSSVGELVEMFPGNRAYVLKYIYILIIFQAIGFSLDPKEKETLSHLTDRYDQVKNSNYFEVLGVTKNSNDADVKKAYLLLAKEYHPDKNENYSQPLVKKLAEDIFDIINKAYEKLQTVQGRHEYDSFLALNLGSSDHLSVEKAFSGEKSFVEGLRFFKKNMFSEARVKFSEALQADKNNLDYSAYYAWLLLLERQTKASKKLKPVTDILEKNLLIDGKHETSNLVAGYLAKYVGDNDQALGYFNKVLDVNHHMLDAKREVKILSKKNEKKKTLLNLTVAPKK